MEDEKLNQDELFTPETPEPEEKIPEAMTSEKAPEEVQEEFESPEIPARSFGAFLRKEREKRGMSAEEVYQAVKIKPELIVALEEEDYDHLPESIYVIAYVKKLCAFYHVKNSAMLDFMEELHRMKQADVPEDFSKAVKLREVNEENVRRIHRLLAAVIAILLLFFALVALGITLVVVHLNKPANQAGTEQLSGEEILLKLQDQPKLKMTEL